MLIRHLYIHIPFCNHICAFCDFRRIATKSEEMMEKFVEMVLEKVRTESHLGQYTTIYLGGGTPNHLPNHILDRLLSGLRPYLAKHYEWTIECNPELLTPEQIDIFLKNGLNRISLGVQSTNNHVLKMMHRYHTIEDAERAVHLVQNASLKLSLDFIYDLPGSSIQDIEDSIQFLVKNNIRHVSYYALEIKPHAMLKNYQIDCDTEEEQMLYLHRRMAEIGLKRYEISNWSKFKCDQSKHNLAYWQTKPWIGIGYGAHGFDGKQILKTTGKILDWKVEVEPININEQVLMMGLRLMDGLDLRIKRNRLAYDEYRKNICDDVECYNNKLRAKNPDCLDDILLKII